MPGADQSPGFWTNARIVIVRHRFVRGLMY